MFTITTATGKTFNSDYAVAPPNMPMGFIRIVGQDFETVERIFSDSAEFPIEQYPQFNSASDFIDEGTGIRFVLKP